MVKGQEFVLARVATRGAFHLFVGKIFSRVIGVIGGLVLIRLLGPSGYGLLNLAAVAPGIFNLFSDFGISPALTKFLAEYKSKDRGENLRTYLFSGLIFRIIISLGLTVLCYMTADVFSLFIGKPSIAPLIKVASFQVIAWTLYGLSESIFLGLDATGVYSLLMVLYELLGALLPIILVIYGLGVRGAILGMVITILIAGVIGVLTSIIIVMRSSKERGRTKSNDLNIRQALKEMLTYGIPIKTASLATSGMGRFYGFMIATHCSVLEVGNYNAAKTMLNIVNYLIFPVRSILFPTYSKIDPEEEGGVLKKIFRHSIRYSSLLILPVVLLIMVFAQSLSTIIFGGEFNSSWFYLTVIAIGPLTYGLGKMNLNQLFLSQGETRLIIKLRALTTMIGVPLGFLLIPSYKILGVIVANLVSSLPSYIIAVKKVYNKYRIKLPLRDMSKLYLSLIIMAIVTIPLTVIPINDVLKIAIGTLLGLTSYILATLLTKALDQGDVSTLRDIITPQPIIGTIANKLLNTIEWIIKITAR